MKVREVIIESLKTMFLRIEFLERLDSFFCLTFSCSFSVLSRWLLILINQLKFTCAPAITSQKLSIKENDFSQASSSSNSLHFLSISYKFTPHFFSEFSEVSPTQKIFSVCISFGIKLKLAKNYVIALVLVLVLRNK